MSKLTWSEISQQATGTKERHRKHHSQTISSLCKDAQDRIATLKHDETFEDEVFRFRLSGERRLWGFRVQDLFFPLWWDAGHQVYPTEPN